MEIKIETFLQMALKMPVFFWTILIGGYLCTNVEIRAILMILQVLMVADFKIAVKIRISQMKYHKCYPTIQTALSLVAKNM